MVGVPEHVPGRAQPPLGDRDQANRAGEPLSFRRRPGRLVAGSLLWLAAGLLVMVTATAVIGRGPIDYRLTAAIAVVGAAALLLVLAVSGGLLAVARVEVSDAGITAHAGGRGEPIGWERIAHMRVVWHPFGRRLVVGVLQAGRLWPVPLAAPSGSIWVDDSSFAEQLEAVTALACRHRVPVILEPGPRRSTAVVAVIAVVAAATVAAVARGVIWPWTPTLPAVAAACPALAAAGLDRYWPAAERDLSRDERDAHELGVFSYCTWTASGPDGTSRFVRLDVVVKWHGAFAASSAVSNATSGLAGDRDTLARPERPVRGLGDEAYMSAGKPVEVVARRANATVSISLAARSDADARTVALALCSAIVAAMRPP